MNSTSTVMISADIIMSAMTARDIQIILWGRIFQSGHSATAAMERQLRFDELTGLYSKQFYYHLVKERLEEDKERYIVLAAKDGKEAWKS